MSHESKEALEKIISLCAVTLMTDRLVRVFDIAMEGMGMTASQRRYEIQAAIQRKRDTLDERRKNAKGACGK